MKKIFIMVMLFLFPMFLIGDATKCNTAFVISLMNKDNNLIKINNKNKNCILKTINYCLRQGKVLKGFDLLVRTYKKYPNFIKKDKIYQIVNIAQYLTSLKNKAKKENDCKSWNKLAVSYYKMGIFKEAIMAYKKSLSINPQQVEPRLTLALSLSRIGQKYSAIEELEKVISLDKDNFYAYYYAGKILKYQIDDKKRAIKYLKKAMKLSKISDIDKNILKTYKKDLENELKN